MTRPISYKHLAEKLRAEGSGAVRKHLSLGMWKQCADAADAINTLEAQRDVLLEALVPFALAHKKLELVPAITRYSFSYAELALSRATIEAICKVEEPAK